jgi:DnaJ-class molecular chaperone
MRRVICSACDGKGVDEAEKPCTGCAGLGSFEHWRNRRVADIKAERDATERLAVEAERELEGDPRNVLWIERRDYWRWRIQALENELREADES